jgi:O-antigen ligase
MRMDISWFPIGVGAVLLTGMLILQFSPLIIGGAALVMALLSVGSVSLGAVIWILMSMRPSIDIFAGYTVEVSEFVPSINLSAAFGVALILSGALFLARNHNQVSHMPLTAILSGFFAMAVFWVPFGEEWSLGIAEVVRIATFLLMFVLLFAAIRSFRDLYRFVWIVFFASIVPALVGTVEFITGQGIYTNPGFDNRIMATFGHPNVFGYFLVIVLAVAAVLWVTHQQRWNLLQKGIFGGYMLLLGGLLLATYTRGAWIAALFVLGATAWWYYRASTIISAGLMAILGVLLITMSSVLNFYTAVELPSIESIPVYDRVTDMFEGKVSDSILWRSQMWRDMWHAGWQNPWVGAGTGHVTEAVEDVRGVRLGSLEVHNDYIRVFVEWGIIGLCVYVWFVAGLIGATFKRLWRSRHPLFVVLFFLLVGIYVASGWDNLLRQTANMWFLFGLLGAAFKWYQLEMQTPKSESSVFRR